MGQIREEKINSDQFNTWSLTAVKQQGWGIDTHGSGHRTHLQAFYKEQQNGVLVCSWITTEVSISQGKCGSEQVTWPTAQYSTSSQHFFLITRCPTVEFPIPNSLIHCHKQSLSPPTNLLLLPIQIQITEDLSERLHLQLSSGKHVSNAQPCVRFPALINKWIEKELFSDLKKTLPKPLLFE